MEKNLLDNQNQQFDSSESQMDTQQLPNNIILNNKKNSDESAVPLTTASTSTGHYYNQSFPSGVENNQDDVNRSNNTVVIPQGKKEYDPTIDDRLPETVTLLRTPDGGKVYLVGTAHFSEESQNDVSMIIQAVQPNIVMVELCEARVHILQLDEKTILKEAEKLNLDTIRATIRQNGLFNGMLYVLLLNMSAHLTRQLGMAPGGEFRRAFAEATKIPKCLVHLGDRPINITLQRALSSLTWWQTIKLVWNLLRTKEPISKEDVERCKRRDLLEDLLAEMGYEFPCLGEVFVKERDLYLTHSLQLASLPIHCSRGFIPSRVVGIVGIGHMPGIIKYWGKVNPDEITPIMKIPEKSMSSKIIKITVKVSLIGAVLYIGYKYIPLPSGSTFLSFKSSVEGLFKLLIMEMAKCGVDEYEHLLDNVMYVVSNIPGKGIDIDDFESVFSNGCSCKEQCNEMCSCVRKKVNYIDNLLFNDEKLNDLIFECNPACSCLNNNFCNNRLVQNGPLNCLKIINSGDKGFGLITKCFIKKNQFICEYAGEIIGIDEAKYRIEDNKIKKEMNYILVVTENIGDNKIVTCIDPKYFGNIGRYCNHSCQPNANLVPIRVESLIPRLCLFASKDIIVNEEITFDYAGGLDKSFSNVSETPCLCDSDNCVGFLPHHSI